jgi:hypothetical protein
MRNHQEGTVLSYIQYLRNLTEPIVAETTALLADPTLPEVYRADADTMYQSAERVRTVCNDLCQMWTEPRASMAWGDFSTSSFELRTPLNALIGFSRLILKAPLQIYPEPLHESQKARVGQINSIAQHLVTAVNNGLDYGRITVGRIELDFEPVTDLSNLLDGIARQFDRRLSCEIFGPMPTFSGDEFRLRQILMCVQYDFELHTPIAYSHLIVDSTPVQVRFAMSAIQYSLRPAELARLLASETVDQDNINLRLAKALTELHGGEFDYLFEEGITFTVQFPIDSAI